MTGQLKWPENRDLAQWCENVCASIASSDLPDEVKKLYMMDGMHIPHFLRVTDKLWQYDPTLAKSGFVHGIPVKDFKKLKSVGLDEGEKKVVTEIITDWLKIIQIDPKTLENDRWQSILPEINWHSIILFIVAQLDHIDPNDAIYHWTLSFCREAKPFKEEVAQTPFSNVHACFTNLPLFIERVYCPIAEQFGFWNERNTANNAILYHQNPNFFHRIVNFAIDSQSTGHACDIRVESMKKAINEMAYKTSQKWGLPYDKDAYNPRWEWRHVGSIAKKIDPDNRPSWEKYLDRCGYVTLTVQNDENCYSLLGFLSANYPHRVNSIKDHIGIGAKRIEKITRNNQYKALHISLLAKNESITIRIIPHSPKKNPENAQLSRKDLIQDLVDRRISQKDLWNITAFTPSGKPVILPPGATILNFSYAIHNHLVGLVEAAVINKQKKVDVLHVVKDNDEVQLIKSERMRPLPEGWEERVPKKSVNRIKKAYAECKKKYERPYLHQRGRSWLANRLSEKGLIISPDSPALSEIIFEAANRLFPKTIETDFSKDEWWLRQLGLFEEHDTGAPKSPSLKIDKALAFKFVGNVFYMIEEKYDVQNEIDLLREPPAGCSSPVCCKKCAPDIHSELVWNQQGRSIIIHRKEGGCCKDGLPARWYRRISQSYSFFIQSSNRVGVAADICDIFRDANVDILELSGKRIGPRWGCTRIQTETVSPTQSRDIITKINRISGVHGVQGPDDEKDPLLESAMFTSTPGFSSLLLKKTAPYHIGSPVSNPNFFYGRTKELKELEKTFSLSKNGDGVVATEMVFVNGPFKTGKTSLVYQFISSLKSMQDSNVITAYTQSGRDTSWNEILFNLNRKLIENYKNIKLIGWQKNNAEMIADIENHNDVLDTLSFIRNNHPRMALVLAIDEVARLFANIGNHHSEISKVENFCAQIQNIGRIFLIWIGPTAPIAKLNERLSILLRGAKSIEMEKFNDRDAAKLLKAFKLQNLYDIELSRGIARSANRFCGGSPYWLSYLGKLMWNQYEGRGDNNAKYTPKILDFAKQNMVLRDQFFSDRIRYKGSNILFDDKQAQNDTLLWEILMTLVDGRDYGQMKTIGQIQARLKKDYSREIEKEEIFNALHELQAWGSVRKENKGSRYHYRLYCQALYDYMYLSINL